MLFHELGHFIMAKRAGVRVDEFGIGFPPKIFSVKRGETVYSINLIPLGGFVKIMGEDGENKDDVRSFASKSVWERFKMLVAGVTANVILAIIIFTIVAMIGMPTIFGANENIKNIRNVQVMILDVSSNSPAKNAGIKPGDIILSISVDTLNAEVKKSTDVEEFVAKNLGKEITYKIKRGNEVLELKALARKDAPKDEGATGIALAEVGVVSYSFLGAIGQGFQQTWTVMFVTITALFGLLKSLVTSGHVSGQLTGPVGIASMIGQTAQLGLVYILQFTALLSVNLAIINVLPFPALDGGRIFFLALEKIKGRPVSQETEGKVHTIGFALLILLMVLITARDFGTYNVWGKIKGIF